MEEPVEFRVILTDSQPELLRPRSLALPFKVGYQEEQRGLSLLAIIACTTAQERTLRDIPRDVGASATVPEGRRSGTVL